METIEKNILNEEIKNFVFKSSNSNKTNLNTKKAISYCALCKTNKTVHPFYVKFLTSFLNSKYMIKNSSSCSKHKRIIRRNIIIARHLGLIDY